MSRTPLLLSLAILCTATFGHAEVKIDKLAYDGWPNCYRISNGDVELIVTTDVGPRIMRYGFVGGQNLFVEFKDEIGKSGEPKWFGRGGHRLWAAPESLHDTYALDNSPVQAVIKGHMITLTGPVEKETGLQKEIAIRLNESGPEVDVTHHIKNAGPKSRELAPWALTQMAVGGLTIVAFPPRGTHEEYLAPTNPLTMWAYTDFTDPRWTFTSKYILLQQQPGNKRPQKTGLFNQHTVGAYLLGSDLFVKKTVADPKAKYPDFGCSYETYTADTFLEMETLGPLVNLQPGQTASHTERWSLYKNVKLPAKTDAAIDSSIGKYMK